MKKLKHIFEKVISKENRWLFFGAIILGLIIGLLFSSGFVKTSSMNLGSEMEDDQEHSKNQIWTCSMHPQIRQPKPGKCPICGMELIPVQSETEEVGVRQLKLSENAIKLAEIQTVAVERRKVSTVLRMSGKIAFNETNVANITSRIPGRIDNIYVNYTGIKIKKGQKMVNLYSPELITAQQELLQSLKSMQTAKTPELNKIALENVEASREKLYLWGLTKKQIREFENRGDTVHHMIIYSPMDGIVIKKDASEGLYVKTGTNLYTIANLSDLWVNLDAYESDISWIKSGDSVEFETETYPGEIFNGKVNFIDPIIDPKTRTVKVRVNVNNSNLSLKPDMFVRARIYSKFKNEVKDGQNTFPLVIPASAPLITGKRAVVYVAVPEKKGVFEGRNIILGSRAENYYIVKDGLNEGELVVVNGAFKIDSDLQIQAKPSMMNPEGGGPMPGHDHGNSGPQKLISTENNQVKKKTKLTQIDVTEKFRNSIDVLSDSYFLIKESLSSDELKGSISSGKGFLEILKSIDMGLLSGDSHMEWMSISSDLKKRMNDLIEKKDLKKARISFAQLTDPVTKMMRTFGNKNRKVFIFHCPMALEGKGAFWLQKDKETRNPFFGSEMIGCQDSIKELIPEKDKK